MTPHQFDPVIPFHVTGNIVDRVSHRDSIRPESRLFGGCRGRWSKPRCIVHVPQGIGHFRDVSQRGDCGRRLTPMEGRAVRQAHRVVGRVPIPRLLQQTLGFIFYGAVAFLVACRGPAHEQEFGEKVQKEQSQWVRHIMSLWSPEQKNRQRIVSNSTPQTNQPLDTRYNFSTLNTQRKFFINNFSLFWSAEKTGGGENPTQIQNPKQSN